MFDKFYMWLTQKFRESDRPLFKKIAESMSRDVKVPVRYKLRKALIYVWSMLTAPIHLKRCNYHGKRARTRRRPNIENMGKIFIGDDVNINSRNIQTDLVSGPEGKITLGDSVSINFGVSIVANKEVRIGNKVRIGPYSMIYDSNQHVHGNRFTRADGNRVIIEDDVWLASRVMVLQGSRIGKGSLIASGSIVTGIIPPYVVAAGSPAKIVRFLNPPVNSGFMWERKTDKWANLNKEVVGRISMIASEVLPIDTDAVLSKSFHDVYPGWDSFHHIKFINALENEFNISLQQEELTKITNIRKAASIVQEHLYYTKKKVS